MKSLNLEGHCKGEGSSTVYRRLNMILNSTRSAGHLADCSYQFWRDSASQSGLYMAASMSSVLDIEFPRRSLSRRTASFPASGSAYGTIPYRFVRLEGLEDDCVLALSVSDIGRCWRCLRGQAVGNSSSGS